jgi:hypothetical protein
MGANMSNTRIITCALAVAGVLFIGSQVMAQAGPPSAAMGPQPVDFDAPGAASVSSPLCTPYCGTIAYDNNDLGEIVGSYTDPNIVPHGFLRLPNGHFISFDAPGAGLMYGLDQATVAFAINNLGEIAGQYQDPNYVFHGFVRYPNGHFTRFDAPNAGTLANPSQGLFPGTMAFDINLGGTTAGIYIDANNVYHGFIRSPANKFTEFDPTDSVFTYPCQETCLTPDGTVAGNYFRSTSDLALGKSHGFVRSPSGAITNIDPPKASFTIATSINTKGVIAGYFGDQKNKIHGFLRSQNGSYVTFDDPASILGTEPVSINLAGATTGVYVDANVVFHGFERDADGHFMHFDAPHAGTGKAQGTRPSTNNSWGQVTGWYIDAGGLNHGFLWIPGTHLVGNQQ